MGLSNVEMKPFHPYTAEDLSGNTLVFVVVVFVVVVVVFLVFSLIYVQPITFILHPAIVPCKEDK